MQENGKGGRRSEGDQAGDMEREMGAWTAQMEVKREELKFGRQSKQGGCFSCWKGKGQYWDHQEFWGDSAGSKRIDEQTAKILELFHLQVLRQRSDWSSGCICQIHPSKLEVLRDKTGRQAAGAAQQRQKEAARRGRHHRGALSGGEKGKKTGDGWKTEGMSFCPRGNSRRTLSPSCFLHLGAKIHLWRASTHWWNAHLISFNYHWLYRPWFVSRAAHGSIMELKWGYSFCRLSKPTF